MKSPSQSLSQLVVKYVHGTQMRKWTWPLECRESVTVGQLFEHAAARFPMHPALKYKEGGIWKTITYTGYYDLCIKAAKSFLKVRVGAPYSGILGR